MLVVLICIGKQKFGIFFETKAKASSNLTSLEESFSKGQHIFYHSIRIVQKTWSTVYWHVEKGGRASIRHKDAEERLLAIAYRVGVKMADQASGLACRHAHADAHQSWKRLVKQAAAMHVDIYHGPAQHVSTYKLGTLAGADRTCMGARLQ